MTDRAAPARRRSGDALVCALVTLAAGLYLASIARNGWIPFDDGMLAQTAQRVLDGQLPHRDFDDVYTGGLSLLHALAFTIGGSSLVTLRITLLVVATASIPIWFYVARTFARPLPAALVTLTAFAWSVPNYPAAMPSWYNLVLALSAIASTLRFVDTRRRRWLLCAGLSAGLSVLVKVVGVYLIVALCLFAAYWLASGAAGDAGRPRGRGLLGGGILLAIATSSSLAPFLLIREVPDVRALVELALPPAIVSVSVAYVLTRRIAQGWRPAVRLVVDVYWPLLAGVGAPILAFSILYWRAGALDALIRGVLVTPRLRFVEPTMHTPGGPPLATLLFSLPVVIAITAAGNRLAKAKPIHVAALLALLLGTAAAAMYDHRVMVAVWLSVRMLMLPLALIVALTLILSRPTRTSVSNHCALLLITCAAAWCSLVQFPYSAPIYFSYIAPLVILSAVATATEVGSPAPSVGVPLLIGYLAFAIAVRPQLFPRRPELSPMAAKLNIARGGIYVWPAEEREYTELVGVIRHHARSPWILAFPDLPEVYFLAESKNPTRALYDVFGDSGGRDQRLLQLVTERGIHAVVINRDPQVSSPISQSLDDSLARRFPDSQTIGPFQVRWR